MPSWSRTQSVPAADDNNGHAKKGVLSSFTRKIGLRPRNDSAGPAVDPHFFHPEERSVDRGDRYPTTSLTSPAGLTLDEGRSYFSDDSSLSDHARAGLRKRLTRMRPRLTLPNVGSPAPSPADSRSDIYHTPPTDGSVFVGSPMAVQQQMPLEHEQPPMGMSKAEFRAKRLVEKLRCLLFKGGEKLRHLGKGKKRNEEWHTAEETQPINVD